MWTKGENDMITRREFVAGAACCAMVAGELMGQQADSSKNEAVIEKNENLVTACGLYCGACFAYIATQENDETRLASGFGASSGQMRFSLANMQCDGCLGGGRMLSHVPKCEIRECAATKSKTRRCSGCEEFPCNRITGLSTDGMLHRAEALNNSRQVRSEGIKDWAKREAERWSCSKCQAKIAWYDPECPKCKAPRSDKLFQLKQI